MSEVQACFLGRPIISRHKRLAYTRPAAYAIAKTAMDIPLVIITVSLFEIVFYFMVGFQHNAGKFFTQWVLLVVMLLCFLSFFRTIGAWCRHFGMVSQIGGICIMGIMVSCPTIVVLATLVYQIRSMPVRGQPPHTIILGSITCSVPKLIEQRRSMRATSSQYRRCTSGFDGSHT